MKNNLYELQIRWSFKYSAGLQILRSGVGLKKQTFYN